MPRRAWEKDDASCVTESNHRKVGVPPNGCKCNRNRWEGRAGRSPRGVDFCADGGRRTVRMTHPYFSGYVMLAVYLPWQFLDDNTGTIRTSTLAAGLIDILGNAEPWTRYVECHRQF
jgi:hypothetical protein